LVKATAVSLGLCLLALAGGPQVAAAADAAAGKQLAEGCSGCHGDNGVSQTPMTPSLAGEPDDFIQWQLVYFRNGARKNDVMGPIAESLDNPAIRNLGAYYASLPPPKVEPAPADDAMAQAGGKLAMLHRCTSCHGENYEGIGPAARLAGQREDVLLQALRDFKSGKRVGSGVASMADVTYSLNDSQMQALAHYMATKP
jgi:cytochrome c553